MTTQRHDHLPRELAPVLARTLARHVRATRAWSAVGDGALACLLGGGFVAAACLFDRVVDVGAGWRVPLPWIAALGGLALVGRMLWRLCRRPDFDRAARELDGGAGDARGRLRSALDFSARTDLDPFFAGETALQAGRLSDAHGGVVPAPRARACRWAAGAAVLLVAVVVGAGIESLRAELLWRRFLDPWGNHMRPTATWFEIDPHLPTVLHSGDDLVVRAVLRGRASEGRAPVIRLRHADGRTLLRNLEPQDGAWTVTLPSVSEDFGFVLTMGPVRSERRAVRVLQRPRIDSVAVEYEYPAYMRKRNSREELKGRTVTALEGTKLRLTLRANVPLASADARAGEETLRFAVSPRSPTEATRYHILYANARLEPLLASVEGLESRHEAPIILRAVPDAVPSVNITGNPAGRAYFLTDTLALSYRAQDDIGLAELTLTAAGGIEIPIEVEPFGTTEAEATVSIPVSSLVAGRAESIAVRLMARDTKGQSASSPVVTLRIASNSYDRQLRAALNVFGTGTLEGGPARRPSPHARLEARLAALRGAESRLDLILADAAAGTPVDAPAQKTALQAVEAAIHQLAATESDTRWHAELSDAELMPHLREECLFATVTAMLASNREALLAALTAARAAAQPQEALAAFRTRCAEARSLQEQALEEFVRRQRRLRRELLGYLATTLGDSVRRTFAQKAADADFLTGGRVLLNEIAALLRTDAAEGIAEENRASLEAAVALADDASALAAAAPALEALVRSLAPLAAADALRDSEPALQLDAGLARMAPTPAGAESVTLMLLPRARMPMRSLPEEGDRLFRLLTLRAGGDAPSSAPASAEDRLLWRLHDALTDWHLHAEALRLLLLTERPEVGSVECLGHWIALRQQAFELRQLAPGLRAVQPDAATLLETFLAGLAPLEAWMADDAATLPARLREWEDRAQSLYAASAPRTAAMAGRLGAQATGRLPVLAAEVAGYRAALRATIAEIERTHAYERHIQPLYLRLQLLVVAILRTCDAAEAARLLRGEGPGGPVGLSAAAVIAAKIRDAYRKDMVEIYIPTAMRQRSDELWPGRIDLFRTIDGMMADLEKVLDPKATDAVIDAAVRDQSVAHVVEAERKAVTAALASEKALATPRDMLASLLADRRLSHAAWAEPAWHLSVLAQASRGLGTDAAFASSATSLAATLAVFPAMPKDLETLPAFAAESVGAAAAPERHAALAENAASLFADVLPLARMPLAESARLSWTGRDRAFARAAQGADRSGGAVFRWSLVRAEIERRAAGFSTRQVGTGGMMLTGDDLSGLKIPAHLYLELQRARGGAMPELFRDHAYRYLNIILERAR